MIVSNDKHFREIKESDSHELLILPMKDGIIEYLALSAGVDVKNVAIKIIMADKPEEQLIQGCRTEMLDKDIVLPKFNLKPIGTELNCAQYAEFEEIMGKLKQEIFSDFPNLQNKNIKNNIGSDASVSVTELIENERKEVCGEVIKEITYINNKPYVQ